MFKNMEILDEFESKMLLKKYGVNTAEERKIRSLSEAIEFSREFGFPVVLKVLSKNILHKSDVGGVIVDIQNEEELKRAFTTLTKKFKNKEILIQRMYRGVEVIIGGKRDNYFGYYIIFGLGGVFTEILEDTSLRICPITERDAEEMIREIKGFKILRGYRNLPKANIDEIKKLLAKICNLIQKENIIEMDLNPVIVSDTAIVVDALIIKGVIDDGP